MKDLLLLAALGALGSLLRFHFCGFVHTAANRALASEREFPFGTLFVNLAGSFLIGLLAGWSLADPSATPTANLLIAGFCGSLTTFSTLAVDTQRFLRDRRPIPLATNLALTFTLGPLAAWAGLALAGKWLDS
jgi:CrcB protein